MRFYRLLTLTTIVALWLSSSSSNAQNPYESLGVKVEPLTLSKGKYVEFFDIETVVQIGTVLFNTETNQVVAFLKTDTLYSESNLSPEIISRWLSPDPLASEFPSWSPYNYVLNNPIRLNDPDGRAPDVYIYGPDADKAVTALNNSSSLGISRDASSGKLSASGKASNPAEQKLVEAINDNSIDVNLITKSEGTFDSKDGTKANPLLPGGFEGSEVINVRTVATQFINIDAAKNVAGIIGETTGATITHEINEAYIGGKINPGGNYDNTYKSAHSKASSLDSINGSFQINKDTRSDPNSNIWQGRKNQDDTWKKVISTPK
jgi:hypothetical protein